MKKIITAAVVFLVALVALAGNTHRLLPASGDPCQTDISHLEQVNELPMFHCIGHTEYVVAPGEEGLLRVARWDHIHSWMTLDWHLQRGFSNEHALALITSSSQ